MQQTVQTGGKLSDVKAIAPPPTLLQPVDGSEVSLASTKQLELAWEPVAGALRYALQISRNRLFVDNVIDVDNRTKTRATVAVRGEGTFLWRVAAFGKDGLPGAWSASRELRVSAREAGTDSVDQSAVPTLELDDVKSYGSLFIVAGRTQGGNVVLVNGEAVTVESDGAFTKTVQVTSEGWSFVEVRARNPQGKETVRRHRVFVESL